MANSAVNQKIPTGVKRLTFSHILSDSQEEKNSDYYKCC